MSFYYNISEKEQKKCVVKFNKFLKEFKKKIIRIKHIDERNYEFYFDGGQKCKMYFDLPYNMIPVIPIVNETKINKLF